MKDEEVGMDAMNAIFTRRSIRKYTDRQIDSELIKLILKAGMYAPSAKNLQPWKFLIITDRSILNKIPQVHPYANMIREASVGILVCADLNIQSNKNYCAEDCSASTQNILLAAHANGIGAVWLGVYPREKRIEGLKELLQLPENILPISLISLGYPDEIKEDPKRYDESKIHYNMW